MHAYQQYLLSDMPTLVASALDEADPRGNSIGAQAIVSSLQGAAKVSVVMFAIDHGRILFTRT